MKTKFLSIILSLLFIISAIYVHPLDVFAYTSPKGVIHSRIAPDLSRSRYRKVAPVTENMPPRTFDNIPESYDSRDYGYITSIKNQGSYGCCWAMGAMAASEASLVSNNGYNVDDINLSELHLAYYTYNDAYDSLGLLNGDSSKVNSVLNVGGMHYMSVMSLARWAGVVDEKESPDFAFSKANEYFDIDDKTTAYSQNTAIIDDAYWIYMANIDHIKSKIMEYGAGIIAYYIDDDYFNPETAAYYYDGGLYANHEVSVIGWDDNFPKENFLEGRQPKNNGAWLVKNSYGPYYGDHGYFWLSYEDAALNTENACFISYKDSSTYDNNYQYDGTVNFADFSDGTNSSYGGYTGGGYMANVFTAQSKEELSAISFFTYETSVFYEINVYTDIPNGATKPTEGTKVYSRPLTGIRTYSGYHTIDLPESIVLDEGENFSVIVHIYKDSSTLISLMCDISAQWDWIKFVNHTEEGQSYFSENGTNWTDISDDGINFRVKAFTKDIVLDTETDSLSESDTITDTETDTTTESDTVTDTETDTTTESDIVTDTETDTATESDTVTDTETDTTTESDTVTDTETDTTTESDTVTDTETDTTTESDIIIDTETDAVTESDTEYDTQTDTSIESDTSTEDPTDTDNPIVLTYGDVDGDGEINMLDVTSLQKVIARLKSFSDYNSLSEKAADVNGDGKTTMEDVVMIQKHIAKLITLQNNNKNIIFGNNIFYDILRPFLVKNSCFLWQKGV